MPPLVMITFTLMAMRIMTMAGRMDFMPTRKQEPRLFQASPEMMAAPLQATTKKRPMIGKARLEMTGTRAATRIKATAPRNQRPSQRTAFRMRGAEAASSLATAPATSISARRARSSA